MPSPYLCAQEVADLLGKSLKWTYQNQKVIPGRFKLGKSIFWDKEVLINSIREQAGKPVRRELLR
jgi:predicted DNA-binding transcriptional regulator AlpA